MSASILYYIMPVWFHAQNVLSKNFSIVRDVFGLLSLGTSKAKALIDEGVVEQTDCLMHFTGAPAPLIPDVALVLFPPQNEDLSSL